MKEAALVGALGAPGNDEHAKKPLPGPWQKKAMWEAEALKEVAVDSPRVAGANQTSRGANPMFRTLDSPKAAVVHSVERKPLPGRQKSTLGSGDEGRAWVRASEMERECQREEVNLLKPPKVVWY